jgi:pimeloyl-ACP methyl ester carboxylesterase
MQGIADEIAKANLGTVVMYEYASTRASIAAHAQALGELVEGLPGNPELVFVGHSLGNIVARHVMGDWKRSGQERLYGQVRALVMFGPPNQGADIARNLGKIGLYEIITGRAGMELGPAWESIAGQLDHPTCPVLIVAGDRSESSLQNPIIRGPSDFVVRIQEAHLEGAEIFLVPGMHSFLMDIPEAQQATLSFLRRHLPC